MKKILLIAILGALTPGLYSQDTTTTESEPTAAVREDALVLYRNKQYARAVEVCLEELKIYSDDQVNKKLDSYTVMCWSLIRQKKYTEVIKYGNEALSVFPYDQRIIETLGEAYFYKGDNVNGLKFFEKYAVLNPTGKSIQLAYYYMGEIYIRLGEFAHADIALSTALYHSPNSAFWWSRLAYAMEMQDNTDGALESYNKALKLQPGLEDALSGVERLQAN